MSSDQKAAERPRSLSIEHKLPILMTGLLVLTLGTSLILAHRTLIRGAELGAGERLARGANEVASSVEAALRQRAEVMRQWAATETVRAALRQGGSGSAPDSGSAPHVALDGVVPSGDSLLALELLDPRGSRVLAFGPAVTEAERTFIELPADLASDDPRAPSPVTFGRMYGAGDDVYFWSVAPVRDRGRVIGYLAQQRRVGGPQAASQALGGLLGEDVTLYMRNVDTDFWMRAPSTVVGGPVGVDSGAGGVYHIRSAGRTIAAEAAIGGSPWAIVLETPVSQVRRPAFAAVARLSVISLLLVAIGAVATWLISRQITRPLISLTTAAEALAHGDYDRRVDPRGGDEVGRLSAAFNRMAGQVAASRRELERRIREAQTAVAEREQGNRALQQAIHAAEKSRAEAEGANRAKGDFLAVMSHELRTPLNAIGGYAQLLEMGVHGPVSEAQRDALARIARSQGHLLALIDNVLNFARIDAGHVELAIGDVPLRETIAAVEPLVAPQMRSKGVGFVIASCPSTVLVRADREKLEQILLNLLANAIKFTPSGGRIQVECERGPGVARIRVRDNGTGIAPERIPAIFDPFVQGERALNRPNEGVGLGLAISRDLARAMGGDIEVESTVGLGSVFTVTLPAGGSDAASRIPPRPRRERGTV